jgi:hypothetical protein
MLTVDKPSKLIYIAGQTPADEKYQPVHSGDCRAQYIAILEGGRPGMMSYSEECMLLTSAFMKVITDPTLPLPWNRARPSPSTLIGVTALSNPRFLIEVEIVAVVEGR